MVGLESCQSQPEELQGLVQLLQLQSETKVKSPIGKYVGENSVEEGEVKQVVKNACSDDDEGKADQISKSDGCEARFARPENLGYHGTLHLEQKPPGSIERRNPDDDEAKKAAERFLKHFHIFQNTVFN